LAEKYFAEIKPSELKAVKPQAEIQQRGVRKTTIKLPAKLPYIVMGYKVPVLNSIENENEAYALEVLAGILDGGASARLASRLVRGKQIAVSAGAGYDLVARLPELFMLDATPVEGQTVFDMEYALKQEIYDLKTDLVSADELQRVSYNALKHRCWQVLFISVTQIFIRLCN
jgi:zinc protease